MKRTLISAIFLLFVLGNAQAQMEKANKQFELNRFQDAIKNYLSVVNKDSNNSEAYCKIGECYYLLNQFDEAKNWYAKGITLPDVNPMYVLQYGKLLMGKGDYEAAKTIFMQYMLTNKEEGTHWIGASDFAASGQELPSLYKVSASPLNSPVADFGIALNGNRVIYSSARKDIKRKMEEKGGSVNPNQLFVAEFEAADALSDPLLFKSDLKNTMNQGPVAFSGDGRWVVYTKNNFVDGTRMQLNNGLELSMYIAPVKENGNWGESQAFPFNNEQSNGYASLNQDGSIVYFASDRPGGFGGFDLYFAKKTAETWTEPINLGQAVNTIGNEITPYFDGSNLFFASDYHSGFGGMDIFRAEKKGNEWEKIFHLGTGVNSSRDDYGFVIDGKKNRGFLVSNRVGGKGAEDIYQVSKQTESIIISIFDEFEKTPIEGATIDFSKCGEKSFLTNAKGQYTLNALGSFECEAIFKKDGYMTFSKSINYANGGAKDIQILLRKDGSVATGKVLSDKKPLSDVIVKATNQANGKIYETMTNESGDYTLGLDKNQTFILRFSKAGFKELSTTIETARVKANEVLPTMNLFSTYTTSTDVIEPKPPIKKNQDFPKPPSTTSETGYSIQLASVAPEKTNLAKYENLKELGSVYASAVGTVNKIRLGPFMSKRNADLILESVKEKGYKDAFIVSEAAKQTGGQIQVDPIQKVKTPKKEDAPIIVEETDKPKEVNMGRRDQVPGPGKPAKVAEYKVRIGTYRDATTFNAKKLVELGEVAQMKSGEFTVMLLSGFESLDAAKFARDKAIDLGYKDAYLVTEEYGKLKKVNQ